MYVCKQEGSDTDVQAMLTSRVTAQPVGHNRLLNGLSENRHLVGAQMLAGGCLISKSKGRTKK